MCSLQEDNRDKKGPFSAPQDGCERPLEAGLRRGTLWAPRVLRRVARTCTEVVAETGSERGERCLTDNVVDLSGQLSNLRPEVKRLVDAPRTP